MYKRSINGATGVSHYKGKHVFRYGYTVHYTNRHNKARHKRELNAQTPAENR